MTHLTDEMETNENMDQNRNKKWELLCKTTNIILSVLYELFSWLFGLVGIMVFFYGPYDEPLTFTAICWFLMGLLLTLMPIFCILSIVFSVSLRKKAHYSTAFLLQFVPFGISGAVMILFFLSAI